MSFTGILQAATAPDSGVYTPYITVLSKVGGWTMQTGNCRFFTAHTLFDVINGGAEEYINTGMIDGLTCSFAGPDSTNTDLYLENFVKPDNAKKMIAKKKESASEPKTIPGIKTAEGFYDEVIGGCMVYFCFGAMYCELTMTGFKDVQSAIKASKPIIAVLKK